jgi:hypothetical protein
MELDTFLTELYRYIDDWYKHNCGEQNKRLNAAQLQPSSGEVLMLAIAGQRRMGVAW